MVLLVSVCYGKSRWLLHQCIILKLALTFPFIRQQFGYSTRKVNEWLFSTYVSFYPIYGIRDVQAKLLIAKTEYICNKWPHVCSVGHNDNPVLSSFMTYHRICGAEMSFPFGAMCLHSWRTITGSMEPLYKINNHLIKNKWYCRIYKPMCH
jgi:hypothetical protein